MDTDYTWPEPSRELTTAEEAQYINIVDSARELSSLIDSLGQSEYTQEAMGYVRAAVEQALAHITR